MASVPKYIYAIDVSTKMSWVKKALLFATRKLIKIPFLTQLIFVETLYAALMTHP